MNAERDEANAFWIWAAIEVLRRTGVRIEELLELTHLSLRQYRAPTGEMIPLLQISPSKTGNESYPPPPDLVAILARILRRIKTPEAQVPLLIRYDEHERTFGAPLPHLFQTEFQHRRQVISPGHVRKLLIGLAAKAGIVDVDGTPAGRRLDRAVGRGWLRGVARVGPQLRFQVGNPHLQCCVLRSQGIQFGAHFDDEFHQLRVRRLRRSTIIAFLLAIVFATRRLPTISRTMINRNVCLCRSDVSDLTSYSRGTKTRPGETRERLKRRD